MNKPTIILTVNPDGNVEMKSNISDAVFLRNTLRLAEECLVADALKRASVEQKVIPVHAMPKLVKAN